MPHTPHTVIAYAAPNGPRCQEALPKLQLPNLTELLRQLTPTATLQGAPEHLTPLHERVLAGHVGLGDAADGLTPWAATAAARLGLGSEQPKPVGGWAWITPCQWQIHTHNVEMTDPQQLALTPAELAALHGAMQPYFAEDGITLFPVITHALDPRHASWLAHGEPLRDLPTAALDRVAGQAVDEWMPRQVQAKTLRRLQNEMQMLLYNHPVNDARAAQGLPTVNSFWVSGTGAPMPGALADLEAQPLESCQVLHCLREHAVRDDPNGWAQAWQALDRGPIAELLASAQTQPNAQNDLFLQLTLCGERQAQTFENRPTSLWSRLQRRFAAPKTHSLLKSL